MCVDCVIYVLIVYETDWKVEIGAVWSPWKHLFWAAREQAAKIDLYYFQRLVLLLPKIGPSYSRRPRIFSGFSLENH
jgi:hypothetical protein